MKNKCQKCDYKSVKTWDELSEEEKMVVKSKYSDFSLEQRKKHRFCVRCWFEEMDKEINV